MGVGLLVANLPSMLVDQETVEFNHHGDGKCQSGTHAGGIGLDRFVKIFSQLGKIENKGDFVINRHSVDATNKL
jgi:hypothetical protein